MENLGRGELTFILLFGLVPAAVGITLVVRGARLLGEIRRELHRLHERLDRMEHGGRAS